MKKKWCCSFISLSFPMDDTPQVFLLSLTQWRHHKFGKWNRRALVFIHGHLFRKSNEFPKSPSPKSNHANASRRHILYSFCLEQHTYCALSYPSFFFHFVQSVDESTKSFMTPMCLVCNISCLCISLFSIFVPFFIVFFFFFSSTWLPSRTTSPDVIPGCLACLPRRPCTLWHFKKVASCDHCFYSVFFLFGVCVRVRVCNTFCTSREPLRTLISVTSYKCIKVTTRENNPTFLLA